MSGEAERVFLGPEDLNNLLEPVRGKETGEGERHERIDPRGFYDNPKSVELFEGMEEAVSEITGLDYSISIMNYTGDHQVRDAGKAVFYHEGSGDVVEVEAWHKGQTEDGDIPRDEGDLADLPVEIRVNVYGEESENGFCEFVNGIERNSEYRPNLIKHSEEDADKYIWEIAP